MARCNDSTPSGLDSAYATNGNFSTSDLPSVLARGLSNKNSCRFLVSAPALLPYLSRIWLTAPWLAFPRRPCFVGPLGTAKLPDSNWDFWWLVRKAKYLADTRAASGVAFWMRTYLSSLFSTRVQDWWFRGLFPDEPWGNTSLPVRDVTWLQVLFLHSLMIYFCRLSAQCC